MSSFFRYRAAYLPLIIAAAMSLPVGTAWGEGIDFVLLVDVSRSMMQSEHPKSAVDKETGSDPDRIRWDAAKLVLDLLGPGDRLMICRFNHGCPPIFNSNPNLNDLNQDGLKDKDFFKPWLTDSKAKKEFRKLSERESRQDLTEYISSFNRTDDDLLPNGVGYLDVGGTKIVEALAKVAKEVREHAPSHRPLHVIVLTDGRDVDYESYLDDSKSRLDDSKLRNKLNFYSGDSEAGIGPGVKVPVHCVGLNLKGEDSANNPSGANQARDLLQHISQMTGGAFEEVDDSRALMKFFLCRTRRLRRYWIEELSYPGAANDRIEYSLVANGLAELGVLSYRLASQPSRKFAIEPTKDEPKLEWIGLDEHGYPRPKADPLRTGKDGTLYRYYYFGRAVDPNGELGSSPFSEFIKPMQLKIGVPTSETQQSLVILKGTVEPLFELVEPSVGSQYGRYEKLRIQVKMLSKAHFSPADFRLTARLRRVDATMGAENLGDPAATFCIAGVENLSGQNQDASDVDTFPLVNSDNEPMLFEHELPLSHLKSGTDSEDSYELAVTVFGLSQQGKEHALSRTRQELLPRIFKVNNSLPLKNVDALELSTDAGGDVREFDVRAYAPARNGIPLRFGDIPLKIEFNTPRTKSDDTPLPEEYFNVARLEDDHPLPIKDGQLPLRDGVAKVRVSLKKDRPRPGIQYLPGEFVVTHVEGTRMMKPLHIPLKLRLDLASVQFKGVPREMVAKPGVTSEPIAVVIDPNGRVKSIDEEVSVSLEFLGSIDKSKANASNFEAAELWLQKVGDTLDDPANRKRTIRVKVGDSRRNGEQFRIHLEPRGDKTSRKYRCRLTVDGEGIDSATHDFALDKDAAKIEVEPKSVRIPIGRDMQRRVSFKARLNGLPGERAKVYVEDIQSGETVLFLREGAESDGHRFRIDCCDAERPVELHSASIDAPNQGASGETAATKPVDVDFKISVPEATPYGRYSKELTLVGANVSAQKIRMEVIVNGLEFDVLQRADGGAGSAQEQWEPSSTRSLIQLFGTRMKQTLRIRTGLGEPLTKGEISILQAELFQSKNGVAVTGRDANGKLITGRVGLSEIRLADDRRTAQIDIEFPSTWTRDDKPSTLLLFGSAKETDWLYVKPIRFEFQVYYLDRKEIFEVRPLPIE